MEGGKAGFRRQLLEDERRNKKRHSKDYFIDAKGNRVIDLEKEKKAKLAETLQQKAKEKGRKRDIQQEQMKKLAFEKELKTTVDSIHSIMKSVKKKESRKRGKTKLKVKDKKPMKPSSKHKSHLLKGEEGKGMGK
ncbi:hypothetical protein ADUPG1_012304 [Aduncisulcus paluster]|uniref:Uncharacterized protein n=1 Tax=Aduncisulcus paluster TaxID=2918883 RepID=A0ABQ5JZ11_9EUKA|nr:hypothetical protein ADUPG1_012304 [Aduncisulcus paluster]